MIMSAAAVFRAMRRDLRVRRMHRLIKALHREAAAADDCDMALAVLLANEEFLSFVQREFAKDDSLLGRR